MTVLVDQLACSSCGRAQEGHWAPGQGAGRTVDCCGGRRPAVVRQVESECPVCAAEAGTGDERGPS